MCACSNIFLCSFAFLSIPLHSRLLFRIPFYSASFLCLLSGTQKLAKMNTFKCNLWHKKPSLSNSQFGFQVVILQIQNEQLLSGQLFIQFRFTPRLNKVRGSFFLCWISIDFFLGRKSGTLRWHMEKNTCIFLFFFAFLSIPLHSRCFVSYSFLFGFIPLFPFRDPKTSQNECF